MYTKVIFSISSMPRSFIYTLFSVLGKTTPHCVWVFVKNDPFNGGRTRGKTRGPERMTRHGLTFHVYVDKPAKSQQQQNRLPTSPRSSLRQIRWCHVRAVIHMVGNVPLYPHDRPDCLTAPPHRRRKKKINCTLPKKKKKADENGPRIWNGRRFVPVFQITADYDGKTGRK